MSKKFAFIDAQNTETTTRQILGFIVDWKRLYQFLKNNCSTSRLSTKLRKLTDSGKGPIDFLNIDNIKIQISKDVENNNSKHRG